MMGNGRSSIGALITPKKSAAYLSSVVNNLVFETPEF
jgi:hypothetical protein